MIISIWKWNLFFILYFLTTPYMPRGVRRATKKKKIKHMNPRVFALFWFRVTVFRRIDWSTRRMWTGRTMRRSPSSRATTPRWCSKQSATRAPSLLSHLPLLRRRPIRRTWFRTFSRPSRRGAGWVSRRSRRLPSCWATLLWRHPIYLPLWMDTCSFGGRRPRGRFLRIRGLRSSDLSIWSGSARWIRNHFCLLMIFQRIFCPFPFVQFRNRTSFLSLTWRPRRTRASWLVCVCPTRTVWSITQQVQRPQDVKSFQRFWRICCLRSRIVATGLSLTTRTVSWRAPTLILWSSMEMKWCFFLRVPLHSIHYFLCSNNGNPNWSSSLWTTTTTWSCSLGLWSGTFDSRSASDWLWRWWIRQ